MHRSLAYQKYPSRLVTLIIIDWVHFECDLLMHVEFSRGFVGGPHIHGRSSWEGMPGTGGVDNVGGWEIIGQPGQSNASLLLHLSTSRHRVPQPRESKFKMGVMPVAALSTFYHCSMRYGLELWHWSALPEQPTPCPVGMWGPEAEVWGLHLHWPLNFRKPNTAPRPLAHCWTGQGSADLQDLRCLRQAQWAKD